MNTGGVISIPVALCMMLVVAWPLAAMNANADTEPWIQVLYPNGDEFLVKGETYDITWTSGYCGDIVRVNLFKDGALRRCIEISTENDGICAWTVDEDLEPDDGYQVGVLCTDPVWTEDRSDDYFYIIPPPIDPTITVLYPNGGEVWTMGMTYEIMWTWAYYSGPYVKIELYRGTTLTYTITPSTWLDGSYLWTVPMNLTAASDYRVKIGSTSTSVSDYSDGYLTINLPITVTSPNGGEQWEQGRPYTITWTSVGDVGNYVMIELLKGALVHYVVTSYIPNDPGVYSWKVPLGYELGTDYRIRVSSMSQPYSDVSDEYFSIVIPYSWITVVSPNGGEVWEVGGTYDITWTSGGDPISSVSLDLYDDDGGTLYWKYIGWSINDGVFSWTIPADFELRSDYFMRITSNTDPYVRDFSDGPFSIVEHSYWSKCVIPIDGFPPGDYYCDFYELEYNGLPGGHVDQINDTYDYGYHMMGVSTVTYTVSSAGAISVSGWFSMYDTFTPDLWEGRRHERVYVLDEAATTVLAYADVLNWTNPVNTWIYVDGLIISGLTPDSIVSIGVGRTDHWMYNNWQLVAEWAGVEVEPYEPPSITVTSPNGGEMWTMGSYHVITWTWTGSPGDYVKIELYRGTTLTSTIAPSTYNDGSHGWSIPTTLNRGDDYRIKISSTSTSAYDYSDDYFTLKKPKGGGGGVPPGSKDKNVDLMALGLSESPQLQPWSLASVDRLCCR